MPTKESMVKESMVKADCEWQIFIIFSSFAVRRVSSLKSVAVNSTEEHISNGLKDYKNWDDQSSDRLSCEMGPKKVGPIPNTLND